MESDISKALGDQLPLLGNIFSREKVSLNGKWNYIVDVQENIRPCVYAGMRLCVCRADVRGG